MSRNSRRIGFVMLAMAAVCAGDVLGQFRSWVDPVSGGWADSCRWSIPNPACDANSVPNTAAESAMLGLAGTYTATVSSLSYSIGKLDISNPGTTIRLIYGGQLHLYGPALVNEGQIRFDICPGGSCPQPNLLDFQGNTTISGNGLISGSGSNGWITSAAGVSVVHSAGHTIQGGMRISAAMDNQGYIVGMTGNEYISLDTYTKSNSGTMSVMHGADLNIEYVTINNYGGLIAADGGRVRVFGGSGTPARINGGTLSSAPGSQVYLFGSSGVYCYLDGVHNLADCRIPNGGVRVAGSGVFTNDASVTVGDGGGSHALLHFQDSSLLAGGGSIILNNSGIFARLDTAAGYTLLHPAGHTIRGYGRIDAAMANTSLVSADADGRSIELYTRAKTNDATMQAVGGATLDIYVPVSQSAGGVIRASGNSPSQSLVIIRTAGSVTGGRLASELGAKITLAGGTIADLTNDATVELSGVQGFLAGSGILNNATINLVNQRLKAISNVAVSGPGAMILGSGCELQTDPGFVLANESGHTIRGMGTVSAALVNRGLLLANVAGQGVYLSTNAKTNDGECKATNTGFINVNVDVSGSGDWIADNGTLRLGATGVDLVTTGDISLLNAGKFYSYFDASTNVTTTTARNLTMDGTSLIRIEGVNPMVTLGGGMDFAMTDDSTATWYWDSDAMLTMTGGAGGDCQTANWAKLEVGGQDKGAPTGNGGYASNFDLSKVTVGAGAHVALVDKRNNGNRIGGVPEAMYCDSLTLSAGAVLNLNGYKCYVNGAQVLPGPRGGGLVVDSLICNGLAGDMNCDAMVDMGDVSDFTTALLDPITFRNANPACELGNGDMNGDGVFNALDVQGLVLRLVNP